MPPNKTPMSGKIRVDLFGASADLPRITEIDVEKITPNPTQPRGFFDEKSLQELADSIATKGLLQPILVQEGEGEHYVVVAGERRFRAHKLLGLPTIAAIITSGDSDELALIENVQRENLTPVEEAEGIKRLMDKHGYLHEDAAKIVGKARNTVTALLKVLTLPPDILDECRASNSATKTFLIELAGMTEEAQREVWEAFKAGQTRTRDAVRAARGVKEGKQEQNSPFRQAMRSVKTFTRTVQSIADTPMSGDEIAALRQAKTELDEAFEKLPRDA